MKEAIRILKDILHDWRESRVMLNTPLLKAEELEAARLLYIVKNSQRK